MKILHTIPYFNKASGGPTSCTYQLVKGLVKNGTDTSILTFQPEQNDILAEDSFINYLPDDRKTPLWLSKNFKTELNQKASDFDLIHVNTIWTWPSHLPVAVARKCNLPLIISPHGMLYPQALRVSAWKKKIVSNLFLKKDIYSADCIHATSREEVDHIRNFGYKGPIALIPNCIDISHYPSVREGQNSIRQVGFVGRFNPIKNLDLLIKAWALLGDKTSGCKLVLIGDGVKEYVDELKSLVKSLHLTNVEFAGFLSGDKLKYAIHNLDFLVLPSKSENFGMVVVEALICGVPVIASKGTPWQILETDGCGWWVDASEQELAPTIEKALSLDESDRREMGASGQQLVKREFASDTVALKMRTLYDWILGKNGKPDFVYEN